MNTTTNHNTFTLFSKNNEARIVNAFIKLVDHFTSQDQSPIPTEAPMVGPHERFLMREIKVLESKLASANAKLSQRL